MHYPKRLLGVIGTIVGSLVWGWGWLTFAPFSSVSEFISPEHRRWCLGAIVGGMVFAGLSLRWVMSPSFVRKVVACLSVQVFAVVLAVLSHNLYEPSVEGTSVTADLEGHGGCLAHGQTHFGNQVRWMDERTNSIWRAADSDVEPAVD
jgi:hypothetical protein